MRKTKILVIDDHPLIRDAVVMALSGADTSVFIASDFSSHVESCADPDFVVVDLALPGMGGVESVREARRKWPRASIVVLSATETRNVVLAAIEAGAIGFVPKSYSADELVEVIKEVATGKIHLPISVGANQGANEGAGVDSLGSMTPRQMELLSYLLCGYSNKEIVLCTGLSEKTVKFYLTGLFRLLKVRSRTGAVVVAARAGLVIPPASAFNRRSTALAQ
ncbi:MAG: DNA-binding response regulator [Betaproteobacteria bacterium]|nr:MAG: DNA-binding response regulator [Betaproteobacteria bacterium]